MLRAENHSASHKAACMQVVSQSETSVLDGHAISREDPHAVANREAGLLARNHGGWIMSRDRVEMLYGVDATKSGWVVARATPDLSEIGLYLVPELEPLFWRVIRDEGLLAIDIPIGLPESGPRTCDRAARRALGQPRGSSVFPAPMRSTLKATSYTEACDLSQEASGRKLSRQTWNLLPKIREVDSRIWVERQERIFEAHPEISFMCLAGSDRGLSSNKKRPEGKHKRHELLGTAFPDVDLDTVLASLPNRLAALDDRLDALACLFTASRIHHGTALRFPGASVEFDSRSLRMEIYG